MRRPILVAVEDGRHLQYRCCQLAAQLNDDTYFDFTATVVTAEDIDTATELAAYDVVICGRWWLATRRTGLSYHGCGLGHLEQRRVWAVW